MNNSHCRVHCPVPSTKSYSCPSIAWCAQAYLAKQACAHKPKFHLVRHVTSRHDTYDVSSRACSNMADDEEAVVLECTSIVFCALDMENFLKSEVDMSTPVHAVATPLKTCRASRACRDERVAPCCQTSATRPVPMHGLVGVSSRDGTSQVEYGLKQVPKSNIKKLNRPIKQKLHIKRLKPRTVQLAQRDQYNHTNWLKQKKML